MSRRPSQGSARLKWDRTAHAERLCVRFPETGIGPFLHRNPVAQLLQARILQSERERKDLAGIKKLARAGQKIERTQQKAPRLPHHLGDKKDRRRNDAVHHGGRFGFWFNHEGARRFNTGGVQLKGKPLNSFGLTKKVVYENEEFNLLQAALNIEDGLENLRYNNVVIATDADVDGMHIRLLLITFFLQFSPIWSSAATCTCCKHHCSGAKQERDALLLQRNREARGIAGPERRAESPASRVWVKSARTIPALHRG